MTKILEEKTAQTSGQQEKDTLIIQLNPKNENSEQSLRHISSGANRRETNWTARRMTWGNIVKRLRKLRTAEITKADYAKLTKKEQIKYKDKTGFVFGQIVGGRRKKENVQCRSGLSWDADWASADFPQIVADKLQGFAYVLYATMSHNPELRLYKYRIVMPTDRDMEPDEHEAASRKGMELIGIDFFDPTSHEVNRLMYCQNICSDAESVFIEGKGSPISVDSLLGMYDDWRKEGVRSKGLNATKTLDDPSRPLSIRAVNSAFTAEEGRERFLSDYYTHVHGDKYEYIGPGATGSVGMTIFPNGWMFNFQGSDPAFQEDPETKVKHKRHLAGLIIFYLLNDDWTALDNFMSEVPEYREAKAQLIAEEFDAIQDDPVDDQPAQKKKKDKKINFSNRWLHDIVANAWEIILRDNTPVKLFRRNRGLAEIDQKDDGTLGIFDINKAQVRGILARSVAWYKTMGGSKPYESKVSPPLDVVEDMAAKPHKSLPVINGLTHVPVFSLGGKLITAAGYNPDNRLYYAPNGLKLPDVPDIPGSGDVKKAKHLLLNELFVDFPFEDEASRANFLATALLPFVRPMITGPTPLNLFDAPDSGTGKTLLAILIGRLITGSDIATITGSKLDAEWDKRILSVLKPGPQILLFDNVENSINFPSLNNAITSTKYSGRELGTNNLLEYPNLATWMLTGTNVDISGDVLRRINYIRLDAGVENPAERTGFKHPKIGTWLDENRADLVWSAIVLIQNWIAQGQPNGTQIKGSFESWSVVMGGILGSADIDGFSGNAHRLRELGDPQRNEWEAFLSHWWDCHADSEVTAGDLIGMIGDSEDYLAKNQAFEMLLPHVIKDHMQLRGKTTALGMALRNKSGAVIGGKRIACRTDSRTRGKIYWLDEA